MKKLLLKLITLYQKIISPNHGIVVNSFNGCRFYPTCSHYTKESIEKRGILRGIIKSLWRIIRCNPLFKGGYDPVK